MARNIDETKLERIKEATLQMVVAKGTGGASISEIARKAGVAEGYLYRFYKGKNELVDDLLYSSVDEIANQLETLLSSKPSVQEIFSRLARTIFDMALHEPERIKFLYVLMHDYNFIIQENQRTRIASLCKAVKENGQESGDFHPEVTEEDIYLMGVVYPIQLINLRFKNFFHQTQLGEKEIANVVRICLNSLK